MKIFKKLLIMSIVFTTYSATTQVIFATDDSKTPIIESLLPKRDDVAVIKNLDTDDLVEAFLTAVEESRPAAAPNNAQQAGNTANLKLRAELIRQEILTMNIMKVFAVSASLASIAAGSYIALLLFNK